MKRTLMATAALFALIFAASLFVTPRAQRPMPPERGVVFSSSGYRVERVQVDEETCVVIVSKDDQLSTLPCR